MFKLNIIDLLKSNRTNSYYHLKRYVADILYKGFFGASPVVCVNVQSYSVLRLNLNKEKFKV